MCADLRGTETKMVREKDGDKNGDKQMEAVVDRQTDRQTDVHAAMGTVIHSDRQTGADA